ncbi:MAG: hypothetical protein J6O55_08325 [Lachnospiraceae bacterium]|nr:hypothetical protein [Lachnospiraceae bacterium]
MDHKHSISPKLRAFIAGLTPVAVFRITLITSVIIALAAGIIYSTATKSLHVNINKVDTASVDLNGSEDLGGIEPNGYKNISYRITNNSTKPAYVFIRIEMDTPGLYEVTDTDWVELKDVEAENEIILAYGESSSMTPVPIADSVTMAGRLHCLADAEMSSQLTGTEMDIDVTGCLVYGVGEDGEDIVYSKKAGDLWQAYMENRWS